MTVQAPHQRLQPARSNEKFLVALFDRLWEVYRAKMSYVRIYEKVIADHGASFTNDHIAFRTLATQNPASGYFVLSRIFEALGYVPRPVTNFRTSISAPSTTPIRRRGSPSCSSRS